MAQEKRALVIDMPVERGRIAKSIERMWVRRVERAKARAALIEIEVSSKDARVFPATESALGEWTEATDEDTPERGVSD